MTTNQTPNTAFHNGIFEDLSKIQVPVDSLIVNRAYGAYEFLRINQSKPFYLDRHLNRFFKSLEILRLSVNFQRVEIEQIISEIIQKNEISDFFIKIFAVPESSNKAVNSSELFIIPCQFPDYPDEMYQNGANLIMKEYSRFLPDAKSTNYMASEYWQHEMTEKQAVDVLYFVGNEALETSRGNLFLVKGNELFTPDKNILKGITRSIVMDLTNDENPVKDLAISVRNLFWADEIFITSTTKKIMPIVKIKNATIGDGLVGTVSKKILALYNQKLGIGN